MVLDSRGKVSDLLDFDGLKQLDADRLAGKTIVVDARLGGLSPDGLLDVNSAERPATLDATAEQILPWQQSVGMRLRIVPSDSDTAPGWVREAGWPVTVDDANEAADEWRVERRVKAVTVGDPARLPKLQSLRQHVHAAAEEADGISRALGLDEEFGRMMHVAAALHDSGKDREIWQTAMGAPRKGRPFAKTDGRRADGRALGGYRHEFGSLRDAESGLAELADGARDLARHLIAAHHGWARPVIPPLDPADPPSLSAERAQAAALRFASLQRLWGPWGLAWWESLLRAADWAASSRSVEAGETGETT